MTMLIALNKISHFHKDTWCGSLTPQEIIDLYNRGAILEQSCTNNIEHVYNRRASGISNPRWVYFKLSKDLKTLLGKKYERERIKDY
jgi:hypothetical protein